MTSPGHKHNRLITGFLGFLWILGMTFLVLYLRQPSETGNQVLFGLSAARLLAGGGFALLITFTGAVCISLFHPFAWSSRMWEKLDRVLESGNGLFGFTTMLYGLALLLGGLLLLGILPVAKQAEFIIGVIQGLFLPILWAFTAALILGGLLAYRFKDSPGAGNFLSPLRCVAWLWLFLCSYTLLLGYYRAAAYASHLDNAEIPLLWLGFYFSAWALIHTAARKSRRRDEINRALFLAGIFLSVFVLYGHLAAWSDWTHKNKFEYWDSLALQFLNGKLYLAEGSVTNFTTHDLTLHNGKWYVPIPPLPAVLMMPVMLFAKPQEVFMGDVSMLFGALNAVLVYLVLSRLAARQWIAASKTTIFLLVVLFSFGTNHLWVSIMGEVWFVSQAVTVTFLALAALSALHGQSPWVTGALLGAAMLARPNSLMTWPLLFAVAMQIEKDEGAAFDFKRMAAWTIRSAVPLGLAVAGLLIYNYLRFEDFMDFGYVTISGEPGIVRNAQTYGLFSPVYIPHNLEVMFLLLPNIRLGDAWPIQPSLEGMSVFLSTPVLIYLIRRYEKQWWIAGAWLSILLGFTLLVMYHNTGAAQFGYRYILDMIVPILALLPLGLPKRLPWHFYALWLGSIAMNIYGTAWIINAN
jgi:hypothetical protein